MQAIKLGMAAIGLLGVFAAGVPARADEDERGGWRHQEHRWRGHEEDRWREHEGEHEEYRWRGYGQPPLAYAPPGYYAVPRYYVAPPPAYYAPPPGYYVPPPVYAAPGVSIGFGFGFR